MLTGLTARSLKALGIATAALVLTTATASPAAAGEGSRGRGWWPTGGNHHQRCVPEIDPGTASSALSLVLGGVAMLADRRRKR